MTVQINYKNSGFKNTANNLVLFIDENFNMKSLEKIISKTEHSYINELLKSSDLKKEILFLILIQKKLFF